MRFRIMHESPGRMRFRADVRHMSLEQADLLEAWLHTLPGVDSVTVHERTCGVIVVYHGARTALCRDLSGFTWQSAERMPGPPVHSSRAMNRAYKEKLVFLAVRQSIKRFLLPDPLRRGITVCRAVPRFLQAAKSLISGKLTVDVLDGIAIGASLLTGDHQTAGSVDFLLHVGETLEEWTHKKSVADLARSMSLQVDEVWRLDEDGKQSKVPIGSISPGERIIVHTGNVLPLDGILEEGDVMLNQASLTGESVPAAKRPGAAVYAGSVVEEGNCVVRITKEAGENRYDRIVRMIEDSERLKSTVESRAGSLADRLVPWCLGGSLLTGLLTQDAARAVSVLMVDFSCALKLSMPLAVLAAMREAGTCHISVKGGVFLENVSEAETIVFDKTGTLTHAVPRVVRVVAFGGYDETEMLRVAACLEEHYPHSMARAVVEAAKAGPSHEEELHSTVDYVVAHGISSRVEGKKVIIGSRHFVFEDEKCLIPRGEKRKFNALPSEYSHLYMAIEGKLAAVICVEDPIREEAADVIRLLHKEGVEKIVMMTGDSRHTASAVAERIGLDEVYAEVLPENKAAFIEAEHAEGRKVVMIGDGVNDAPALSAADVGIAISDGAAIAREVADITISADDLYTLVTLRRLSEALMNRIRINYRFIMGFNSALIALGVAGILPPASSALLHNTSTIAISLKSMTDYLK